MDDAKKFEILSSIMRASHFEWRRAVMWLCPDLDPIEIVKKYWEEVGKDTAKFYLTKIDPEKDLAEQVAGLYVASSVAMGEDAEVAEKSPEGHSQARHKNCPWFTWHKKQGLEEEDIAGCDQWLETVVKEINSAMGRSLRFETVESLPGGDKCCLRKFWEES